MSQILIAGKDWQAHALLRAQLIEEGFEVEACETIREAIAALESGLHPPDLFIADISQSDEPSSDVEALAGWSRQSPFGSSRAARLSSRKACAGAASRWPFCAPWTWVSSWNRSSEGWKRPHERFAVRVHAHAANGAQLLDRKGEGPLNLRVVRA